MIVEDFWTSKRSLLVSENHMFKSLAPKIVRFPKITAVATNRGDTCPEPPQQSSHVQSVPCGVSKAALRWSEPWVPSRLSSEGFRFRTRTPPTKNYVDSMRLGNITSFFLWIFIIIACSWIYTQFSYNYSTWRLIVGISYQKRTRFVVCKGRVLYVIIFVFHFYKYIYIYSDISLNKNKFWKTGGLPCFLLIVSHILYLWNSLQIYDDKINQIMLSIS